jgi:cytochrome b6-f complex iron-sulfur subunit
MTTTAARGSRASAQAKAAAQTDVSLPSRREFLYYIWGASVALLLGEATAGLLWFIFPRFKEGEFGGVFTLDTTKVPPSGSAPWSIPEGRFHISHTANDQLVALYGVCTHLGCLPKWVATNNRFECPCHGSKYQLDGTYIEGPAPRSLDRFVMTLTFSDGTQVTTDSSGDPIPLEGRTITDIRVNTGARVMRAGRV